MIGLRKKKSNKGEYGVALIIALLVLLIVTAVGFGMIVMSNTETSISSNFRDAQTVFFAARAGLEEVRDRMRVGTANSLNGSLPPNLPGQNNGVLYVINPAGGETVAPWNTAGANYPDTEICQEVVCAGGVPGGAPWYTNPPAAVASATYAVNPTLNWKWVRVTAKTDRAAAGTPGVYSVDGAPNARRVCWNSGNEYTTTAADCAPKGTQLYSLTTLAVTPSGSRRMLQYEVALNSIPIVAALYGKQSISIGPALNITGYTDPACGKPPVEGTASGLSTVTTPGGGNVTGYPNGSVDGYGWPLGNLSRLIAPLLPGATDITTAPGISGSTPNYTYAQGPLGTVPSPISTDGNGAIIPPMPTNGTPITYYTPAGTTLTIGGGPAPVTGFGTLIVRGNLTIDVAKGFNYYGLILVTGNLTITSSSPSSVSPTIHGGIILGGAFTSPISGLSGSVQITQNSCLVDQGTGPKFYGTIAHRELMN